MQEDNRLKWRLELLLWIVTFVIVILIILPVHQGFGDNYPFYVSNIFAIVLFLTYTRYIFLLKYTLFSHKNKIKFFLVFLSIPLFFYFMDQLYDFQNLLEEKGLREMTLFNDLQKAINISKYTKYQYIFFGSGTMIVLALLPIRMIVSIWRQRNRGTV